MSEPAADWPAKRFELVPAQRGGWVLQRWQGRVLAEDWFEADPTDEADLAVAYDCAVAAGEAWVGEGTVQAAADGDH